MARFNVQKYDSGKKILETFGNPTHQFNVCEYAGKRFFEKIYPEFESLGADSGINEAKRNAHFDRVFLKEGLPVRTPKTYYADEHRLVMEYVDAPLLNSTNLWELEQRFPNLRSKINAAGYAATEFCNLAPDATFVKVHPKTGKFILIATDL